MGSDSKICRWLNCTVGGPKKLPFFSLLTKFSHTRSQITCALIHGSAGSCLLIFLDITVAAGSPSKEVVPLSSVYPASSFLGSMSRRTSLELPIATRLSRGPTGDCMLLECLRVAACQCKIFQLSIARSFVLFSSTRVSICQLTSVFVKCLREYSEECVRHYSAFYVI